MRLFKRKKPEGSLCPRCGQLVTEDDGITCPMCGWDLRDAYQGPTQSQATVGSGSTDSSDGEPSTDPRTV